MDLYWSGRITAVQAADAIGVSWRQVSRDTPADFVWSLANKAWVERLVARRLAQLKPRKESGDAAD